VLHRRRHRGLRDLQHGEDGVGAADVVRRDPQRGVRARGDDDRGLTGVVHRDERVSGGVVGLPAQPVEPHTVALQ
jgi:hypothetical protein